jgi:hypothetical protein
LLSADGAARIQARSPEGTHGDEPSAARVTANVLPNFETSLYFSLKSYTTVGYGDVLLPTSWRLLGPIEAAVGVLMLGWSTSIIVAAVQSIYNSSPIGSKKEP